MKTLKQGLFYITLLTASFCSAHECRAVFTQQLVNIDVQNKTLKMSFENFIPTLERLAQAVDVDPVRVKVVEEGQWAAYDPRADLITSVAQYRKDDNYTNHPKYGRAILTHEYTHGILEAYLKRHSNSWSVANKNFEEARLEPTKAMDAFFEATEKASLEKDPAKQAELKMKVDEAAQRMQKSKKDLELAILERSFSKAYHELTADLIPVLIFKDLNVMENAIRSKVLTSKIPVEWRSFDNHFGPAKLAEWKKTVQKSLGQGKGYDPYYFFAPARSLIGAALRGRNLSESDIHAKLPAIFQAVQRHFEENIAQRPVNSELDLYDLNVTLAREISEVLERPLN